MKLKEFNVLEILKQDFSTLEYKNFIWLNLYVIKIFYIFKLNIFAYI